MPTRLCPYCFGTASWSRRDRTSFGWFCPNHRSPHHPPRFYGYLGRDMVLDPLSDPSVALLALRARYRVRFKHGTRWGAAYQRVNYYELNVTDHGAGWHGWYFRAEDTDARKVLLDAARVLL